MKILEHKGKLPLLVVALVYGTYVLWSALTGPWDPWCLLLFPLAWLTMMSYVFFLVTFLLCKIMGFYTVDRYGWLIYSGELALGGVLAVWRLGIMTAIVAIFASKI